MGIKLVINSSECLFFYLSRLGLANVYSPVDKFTGRCNKIIGWIAGLKFA